MIGAIVKIAVWCYILSNLIPQKLFESYELMMYI